MFQRKQITLQLCLENEEEDFKVEQIPTDGVCINGKC